MAPQKDPVGEGLEAEPVLGQPGDRKRARNGAERHDELLVADVELSVLRHDPDETRLLVERGCSSEQQVRVRAHHPQWDDDVAGLERPRGRLRQHRRTEHEVLGADDRGTSLPEQAADVPPGEPAAEDERTAPGRAAPHGASHIIGPCRSP